MHRYLSTKRTLYFALLLGAGLQLSILNSNGDGRIWPRSPDSDVLERYRAHILPLQAMPIEEILSLVPTDSAGLRWATCPYERTRTRTANWTWGIEDPWHVVCEDCGQRFPDHPDYPIDGYDEIETENGVVRFGYHTEPDGRRLHLAMVADYFRRQYLEQAILAYAELYADTGEDAYARRSVALMDRFAQVFPNYPFVYHGLWRDRETTIWSVDSPAPSDIQERYRTRWDFWRYMDQSFQVLLAFDILRNWDGWKEPGMAEVKQRILDDFIREQADWVRSLPEAYHNMSVSTVYPRQILAARLLENPAWVHEGIQRFKTFIDNRFLYDGHWRETSPSYGSQVLGGMNNTVKAAMGYTDPEGYRHSETGERHDNLDLSKVQSLRLARRALVESRFPDGRWIPLNDTWPRSVSWAGPRESMEPILLPGLGVGILGGGEDEDMVHAYLNFTSGVAHKQLDALSIGLYAAGHELLPTIGYTHTRYRRWASSQASKNTVVVNGRESQYDRNHTGNRVRAWYADSEPGFQIVRAESRTAYAGIVDRFERTLALIGTPTEGFYLLDLFDVQGGLQHDYLLHGSRDMDSTLTIVDVEMQDFEGTLMNEGVEFIAPQHESDNAGGTESGFGFVRNIRKGNIPSDQLELLFELDDRSGRGLRSLMAVEAGDLVYSGESPSVRRAGGRHFQEDESLLDKYLSPFFSLRRSGSDLSSLFVATHEVFRPGQPSAVEFISVYRTDTVYVARIQLSGDRVDYFIQSVGAGASFASPTPQGRLEFTGTYALIRWQDGEVHQAWLAGGNRLRLGDFRLHGGSGWSGGEVMHFARWDDDNSRGYFDIPELIPEGDISIFTVYFPDQTQRTFTVTAVEELDSGTRVFVREDPGFEERKGGGYAVLSYPQRSIPNGALLYSIETVQKYTQ